MSRAVHACSVGVPCGVQSLTPVMHVGESSSFVGRIAARDCSRYWAVIVADIAPRVPVHVLLVLHERRQSRSSYVARPIGLTSSASWPLRWHRSFSSYVERVARPWPHRRSGPGRKLALSWPSVVHRLAMGVASVSFWASSPRRPTRSATCPTNCLSRRRQHCRTRASRRGAFVARVMVRRWLRTSLDISPQYRRDVGNWTPNPERSGGQYKGEAPCLNYHMDIKSNFRLLDVSAWTENQGELSPAALRPPKGGNGDGSCDGQPRSFRRPTGRRSTSDRPDRSRARTGRFEPTSRRDARAPRSRAPRCQGGGKAARRRRERQLAGLALGPRGARAPGSSSLLGSPRPSGRFATQAVILTAVLVHRPRNRVERTMRRWGSGVAPRR